MMYNIWEYGSEKYQQWNCMKYYTVHGSKYSLHDKNIQICGASMKSEK